MITNDCQLGNDTAKAWAMPLVEQDDRQITPGDPTKNLPTKDWEELQARYERDMEASIQNEQSIMDEIEWVMKA
jgi:hypothetical protein